MRIEITFFGDSYVDVDVDFQAGTAQVNFRFSRPTLLRLRSTVEEALASFKEGTKA